MPDASDVAPSMDQHAPPPPVTLSDAALEAWKKQYPMPTDKKDDPSKAARMLYRWGREAAAWHGM